MHQHKFHLLRHIWRWRLWHSQSSNFLCVVVQAWNGFGMSPQSAPSNVMTTPAGVVASSPPTSVVASAASPTTATIQWQQPASDGGSPVPNFQISASYIFDGESRDQGYMDISFQAACTNTSSTFSTSPGGFAGLSPQSSYNFVVQASNGGAAGSMSLPSAPSNQITTPAPPPFS